MTNDFQQFEKVRIKDIAEKAGVSVGTVDRVLHGRPNVSAKARERIEKALQELNYQPNRYASALASNKKYMFHAIMPSHETNSYWSEAELGLYDAVRELQDFNIYFSISCYDIYDINSYMNVLDQVLNNQPDGIVLVPQAEQATVNFCNRLTERSIPFVFLDSNVPGINALSFLGQDSHMSGYFAARMLMLEAKEDHEVAIFHFDIASPQQDDRENGFRKFMKENYPECQIKEITLRPNPQEVEEKLSKFFIQNPNVRLGSTFCSYSYLIGEFALRHQMHQIRLLGYDMIERNIECMNQGIISFLIAQHPWRQGYGSINALFNHIVMKKEIKSSYYMPIELITKENKEYYIKNGIL